LVAAVLVQLAVQVDSVPKAAQAGVVETAKSNARVINLKITVEGKYLIFVMPKNFTPYSRKVIHRSVEGCVKYFFKIDLRNKKTLFFKRFLFLQN
jgi:hypothetical protein